MQPSKLMPVQVPTKWRPLGIVRRPRVLVYKVADRRVGIVLNRYPFCVIGIGCTVGQWCLSIVWGRPAPFEEVRS